MRERDDGGLRGRKRDGTRWVWLIASADEPDWSPALSLLNITDFDALRKITFLGPPLEVKGPLRGASA